MAAARCGPVPIMVNSMREPGPRSPAAVPPPVVDRRLGERAERCEPQARAATGEPTSEQDVELPVEAGDDEVGARKLAPAPRQPCRGREVGDAEARQAAPAEEGSHL